MARQRETNGNQGVIALDHTGDRAVGVLVERAGDGFALSPEAEAGDRPRVALAPWGRSLVRCRGVDDLPPDELVRVLDILGEGELPERVPAWRRGCGALPLGGQGRTALLTAWMTGADEPDADGPGADGVAGDGSATLFTTAPAALGLAVSLAPGCAFASDTAQGVLIVAAHGPEGVLVRALRETPDIVGAESHVERRLSEVAAAVGLHEDEVRRTLGAAASPWDGRRLGWSEAIGDAMSRQVQGWPGTGEKAAELLLPVCAAMLALSPDAAVRALAGLRLEEPASRTTFGQRADAWLSSRKNVAMACVVCLAVVLFAPLVFAKAREAMLSAKVGRAEELRERYEAAARRASIYGQLNDRVWPMTKMLAEVSAAAPVHVVLESVRMDSNAQIDIEGSVRVAPGGPTLEGPPEALLTRYETALNELGTLGSVTIVRREIVDDSVEFQITARVRNAISMGSVPMDYAEMPLAEVLYGEGASNTATPVLASGRSASGRPRPASGSRDSGAEARSARDSAIERERESSGDRRPTGDRAPASEDGVPTPISDEEIGKLDRGQLLNQWRIRNSAARDESNDQETRARLKEEADKLIARYREVGSGG